MHGTNDLSVSDICVVYNVDDFRMFVKQVQKALQGLLMFFVDNIHQVDRFHRPDCEYCMCQSRKVLPKHLCQVISRLHRLTNKLDGTIILADDKVRSFIVHCLKNDVVSDVIHTALFVLWTVFPFFPHCICTGFLVRPRSNTVQMDNDCQAVMKHMLRFSTGQIAIRTPRY